MVLMRDLQDDLTHATGKEDETVFSDEVAVRSCVGAAQATALLRFSMGAQRTEP